MTAGVRIPSAVSVLIPDFSAMLHVPDVHLIARCEIDGAEVFSRKAICN